MSGPENEQQCAAPSNFTLGDRIRRAIRSFLNPKVYIHPFKLLHYYGYSHVIPRANISCGENTVMAPNVSFRNGERIKIGNDCHIGERTCIWAGESTGRISIGNCVSIAPDVFITASDYQFQKGVPFRQQPKNDRNVTIGDDVWLGTKVTITAGVSIGNGCIIGAGAVVTKDIPSNCICGGVPAKVIKEREES